VPGKRYFALSALLLVVAGQAAIARTINLGDNSRTCLSTSIVARDRLRAGSACVAHNSCARMVFATFDVYPLRVRHGHAPVRTKVSHWLKPGDNDAFGWTGANPTPAPECGVIDTHY
jgi:hypothetical protein